MASNKSILEINTNQIDNSNKKNISNMKKTDISNKKKKDISLKYDDWESYIIDRKHLLIKELNDKSYLAKVEDNVKFIDIMKNISNTNILNLTYIGFLFVKFLENIYVDEHIILNCIELYSDEKYFIQSKENSKYIDNLKCLINAIPDMIIKIEFSFKVNKSFQKNSNSCVGVKIAPTVLLFLSRNSVNSNSYNSLIKNVL